MPHFTDGETEALGGAGVIRLAPQGGWEEAHLDPV